MDGRFGVDDLHQDSIRPLFPRGPSLGLKAVLLALLSVGLMFADDRTDTLNPVRSFIAVAAVPVQWMSSLPNQASEVASHFASRESLLAQNSDLREQQLHLQAY